MKYKIVDFHMAHPHMHSVIYPSSKPLFFPTLPSLSPFNPSSHYSVFPFILYERLLPLFLIANQNFMLTKNLQLVQIQRINDCGVIDHELDIYITLLP